MNIVLYNKITNEIERIDIKKYHLSGFALKLFVKKLTQEFMEEYFKNVNYIPEIEIPASMLKTLNEMPSKVYPSFLLTYLRVRCENPSFTSDQVLTKIRKYSIETLQVNWEEYVSFRRNIIPTRVCQEGLLQNFENGKCLKPLSRTLQFYLVDKPVKKCPEGKVYNPIVSRCTKKEQLVEANIMLQEAFSQEYDNRTVLPNLDSDVSITHGVMRFILQKYPYARFIFPKNKAVKNVKKSDYVIAWKYYESKDTYELSMPTDIWKLWEAELFDPSVRFIISFVHLRSKGDGMHANVLIYDKTNNELERFDGLGQELSQAYKIKQFDKLIVEQFNAQTYLFPKPVKYFTPLDYCPTRRILQAKEIDDIPGLDLRGNCATWRIWYINTRIANPHLNRKYLVEYAARKIEETGSLYKFIKSYQKFLLKSYKRKNLNARHIKTNDI